jgi:hypothetical protein
MQKRTAKPFFLLFLLTQIKGWSTSFPRCFKAHVKKTGEKQKQM